MAQFNPLPPHVLHSSHRLTHASAHTMLSTFLSEAENNAAYRPDSSLTERGPVSSSTSGNLVLGYLRRVLEGIEGKRVGGGGVDNLEVQGGLAGDGEQGAKGQKRKRRGGDDGSAEDGDGEERSSVAEQANQKRKRRPSMNVQLNSSNKPFIVPEQSDAEDDMDADMAVDDAVEDDAETAAAAEEEEEEHGSRHGEDVDEEGEVEPTLAPMHALPSTTKHKSQKLKHLPSKETWQDKETYDLHQRVSDSKDTKSDGFPGADLPQPRNEEEAKNMVGVKVKGGKKVDPRSNADEDDGDGEGAGQVKVVDKEERKRRKKERAKEEKRRRAQGNRA